MPLLRLALVLCLSLLPAADLFAQASMRPCPPNPNEVPGPACFTAKQQIGELPPEPFFWYLSTYPDHQQAEAAQGSRSTVVDSLGKIWLFTLANASWHPSGTFVARVGPIATKPGVSYEAVYMQSIFSPGMNAPLHIHSGMEAFYTLTGDTCLETSAGVQNAQGPGNVVLVDAGLPMLLMATGKELRRGVVLILHDSAQPPTTLISDWKPKGLCHP